MTATSPKPTPDLYHALLNVTILVQRHGRSSPRVEEACAALRNDPAFAERRRDVEKGLQEALKRGVMQIKVLAQVEELAGQKGWDSPEVASLARQLAQKHRWNYLEKLVQRRVDRTDLNAEIGRYERTWNGRSDVRPGPSDHRIEALRPTDSWILVIDETGDKNMLEVPRVLAPSTNDRRFGRFVGVLIPDDQPLPALPPAWHATEIADPAVLDRHMQQLLDAPVGVFGLEVDALPATWANSWVTGVTEVVRWALRLLPLGEKPTRLHVVIEGHDVFERGSEWTAVIDGLQSQEADLDEERLAKIEARVSLVGKHDDSPVGWADLVAFNWAGRRATARTRLRQSGLLGPCLQEGRATKLRAAWNAERRNPRLGWDQLDGLLEAADAETPGSLANILLERARKTAAQDSTYWHTLYAGVRANLDRKHLHLPSLGKQLAFLDRCRPADTSFLPAARLAWLTARLEHANHLGATDAALDADLADLCERLFEEEPALVCQADLDRAVRATNRFDFAGATRALDRWVGQAPAVAGLRHHARALSSLGQHAAFLGDHTAAITRFEEALAAFARLSDPEEAAREASQTETYLAIASLDAGLLAEVVRLRVAALVGDLRAEAIATWPGADTQNPYAHHLLLRYLVMAGTPEERAAYREAPGPWHSDECHPWPLIELYRALLLLEGGDRAMAAAHAEAAAMIALDPGQGPTVAFIGLVIARLCERLGLAMGIYPDDDAAVRAAMGAAPWTALAETAPLAGVSDALAWLAQCLPFNFR